MSEVHQLKPIEDATAVLRQQFLDTVAERFQMYMDCYDEPPHSLAFVFMGLKGASTSTHTTGPMEDHTEHVMCSAGHLLMTDSWEKR